MVGQCSEGVVALRMIEKNAPDIAVLDLNLPDLFTLEIVRRVRDANIPTKVVVLPRAGTGRRWWRRCAAGSTRFC